MRYLVKVFTTHEAEEAAVRRAMSDGTIAEAEELAGFVQGVCDDEGLERLRDAGFGAIAVEEAAPAAGAGDADPAWLAASFATPATFSRRLADGDFGFSPMPSVTSAVGVQQYFLLRIPGGITPGRERVLADERVSITERRNDDWYVAKLPGRDTVSRLPFVAQIRLYDGSETLADPLEREIGDLKRTGATRMPGLRVFEAIVHSGVSEGEVAGQIAALGGKVLSSGDRVVRFSSDQADLGRVADIPEISELQEASAPRPLLDLCLPTIGIRREHGGAVSERDGAGELIGIADTGIDEAHPDFAGRIRHVEALGRPGDHSDPSGHGTHVAGIVLGDGAASHGAVRGVAPGAELYFQSVMDVNGRLGGLPPDVATLLRPAYDAGVRVHNDSWGAFLQARYGANSIQLDGFVHANPDFLVVVAAGNQGSCMPGANSAAGFVDMPSIADPASAKNCLSVGASRSPRAAGGYSGITWGRMWPRDFPDLPIRDQPISGDVDALAGFSSRGPGDDNRVKPDLVAPGTDIASTKSAAAPARNFWGAYPGNDHYAINGGTSMAAPLVTGAAAIVRRYYVDERAHPRPSAALLRATIVNGTARMEREDAVAPPHGEPNFHQGFGRLDLASTIPDRVDPAWRLFWVDTLVDPALDFAATGEIRRWSLRLDGDGDLRICLAWTDPPARSVQNTLIMLLDAGPLRPKIASNGDVPRTGLAFPTRVMPGVTVNRDPANNLHVIRVPDAKAGLHTLSVIAVNVPKPPQSFALVATGRIAELSLR